MNLLCLFLGLIYTTLAENVNPITNWLDEKSGYCKPGHWYSMGPCQHCYCRESNRLVCNGNDQFTSSDIQLGSEKLTFCLTDLKKDTDRILGEVDPVPSLRHNPSNFGDVSSEEKHNPEKKGKEIVEAKLDSAPASDSGSEHSLENSNIRMPLKYPSVNDSPKVDHDESDDSNGRSTEEDSRKFLTRKQSGDKYDVGVKIKGDMIQTDDQTVEATIPKEMTKMMFDALSKGNINLGNLMPMKNSFRKAAAVSTRDYVLAYILV